MQQDTSTVLILAIVVLLVAVAAWALWRVQRRRALAHKYGAEYERLARDKGGPDRAARELEEREKRVSAFKLRDLTPSERDQHAARWSRIQSTFVDEPAHAAQEAHALLSDVMRDRGYPEADLAQRQRDLSVNYPDLIEPYREACDIAARRGGAAAASTEDLRRATIVYRSLIDSLLSDTKGAPAKTRREVA
jgi:hypothetical protein